MQYCSCKILPHPPPPEPLLKQASKFPGLGLVPVATVVLDSQRLGPEVLVLDRPVLTELSEYNYEYCI